jgi:hypothetical protein
MSDQFSVVQKKDSSDCKVKNLLEYLLIITAQRRKFSGNSEILYLFR